MVDAGNVKDMDAAYKKAIAAYLIQRAQQDVFLLEAMAKEGKSLDGVLAYVKSEARKQQKDGVAVIPDDEVYGWAVHYILEDSLDFEPKAKAKAEVEAEKSSEDAAHVAEQTKAIQSKAERKARTIAEEIQPDLFGF